MDGLAFLMNGFLITVLLGVGVSLDGYLWVLTRAEAATSL
jgi:hypothetical protein